MFRLGAAVTVFAFLATAAAGGRDLTIVTPDLQPMFTRSGSGFEGRIITETLQACGYGVKLVSVPFVRHFAEYKAGSYDGISSVPPDNDLGGADSVVYLQYQPGATVLAKDGLTVSSVSDLYQKRVVTFVDARRVLPGLKAEIPRFASYSELADQLLHSNLLFSHRVDAVLADGLIMAEYNRQLRERVAAGEVLPFDPNQEVVFTAIFPPEPNVMVFKDTAVRDDFNRCYASLQKSGRIDEIRRAAIEPFRATLGRQYWGR